jgi:hypothetical protein
MNSTNTPCRLIPGILPSWNFCDAAPRSGPVAQRRVSRSTYLFDDEIVISRASCTKETSLAKHSALLNPQSTRPLFFLISDRRRFCSTILCLVARDRVARCRRRFAAAALCSCNFSAFRRSNSSTRRKRARCRFMACERESCTEMLIPLGRWVNVTAVETLFTCCPPGPEERAKISSRSDSSIRSLSIRAASAERFIFELPGGVIPVSGDPPIVCPHR